MCNHYNIKDILRDVKKKGGIGRWCEWPFLREEKYRDAGEICKWNRSDKRKKW